MKTLFLSFLIAINFAVTAMSKDSFLLQGKDIRTTSVFIKNNFEIKVVTISLSLSEIDKQKKTPFILVISPIKEHFFCIYKGCVLR